MVVEVMGSTDFRNGSEWILEIKPTGLGNRLGVKNDKEMTQIYLPGVLAGITE